ncbi:MAG: hypothetical protein N2738_07900 [Thermodesulfovibrionales bacterium]|nr:hypothetical protein [Thermodesulfovibrionales bacterium]
MTLTISPLYILFAIEAVILIIIFAIVMAIGRSKYKKLYNKLLSSQNMANLDKAYKLKEQDHEKKEDETTTPLKEETPLEQRQEDNAELEAKSDIEKTQPDDTKDTIIKKEDDTFSFGPIKNEGVDKLKKVVDFQKEKIINLMCYKDILESAQKKLINIHTDYKDLEQRFTAIQNDIGENKEYELALEMFGENTKELREFIDALQSENDALLEKFNSWEGQLKDMWAESEDIAQQSGGADVEALMAEKQEMMEKIKEFEEKIKEKTKQLEDAQAQYEDLENEYMTLYRQQQASQGK